MDIAGRTAPDERAGLRLVAEGNHEGVNVGRKERVLSAVAGGALALYALRRRDGWGLLIGAFGVSLLKRGATGHCGLYARLGVTTEGDHLHAEDASVDPESSVAVECAVVVNRSRTACYEMWRDFSRLPRYMDYLERVEVIDETHSRWYASGPVGITVEWDAEIVRDVENERISWRSIDPADVPNRGTVEFHELPDGATEVRVQLEWDPPGGVIARAVAAAFRRNPQVELTNALDRFRQVMDERAADSGVGA